MPGKWIFLPVGFGALLAFAALALTFSSGGAETAHAQPEPIGPTAANGTVPGTVRLTWAAIPEATEYRLGWLAVEDHEANPDTWRKYFAYSDVGNVLAWDVTRLTPGIDYYFIVGGRLPGGNHAWTAWTRLTVGDSEADSLGLVPCPDTSMPPATTNVPTRWPALPALPSSPAAQWEIDHSQDAHLLSSEALAKIRDLPWVADGIVWDDLEVAAVEGLIDLAVHAEDTFSQVIEQSWVVEGRYNISLAALGGLSSSPEVLALILQQPTIADGIDQEEAARLGVMFRYTHFPEDLAKTLYDENFVEMLFDQERVSVEEMTIALPLRDVAVTVVQMPQTRGAMKLIENSVRTLEGFISASFPYTQVLYSILENDPNLWSEHGGHGHRIPGIKVGNLVAVSEANDNIGITAHETAHFYYGGWAKQWVVEGAAEFLTSIVISATSDEPISLRNQGICRGFKNIEESEYGTHSSLSECPYVLGERLFHDLYQNMDETSFRLAFRNLFVMLNRHASLTDGCEEETVVGICHVKTAFNIAIPAVDAARASEVIDDWYGGDDPQGLESIFDTDRMIHGTVLGPNGEPVAEVYIEAQPFWTGDVTGTDGTFEITPRRDSEGEFVLSISSGCGWAGYHGPGGVTNYEQATRLELSESAIFGIVVHLPAEPDELCNTVTGTVLGPDSQPVAGIQVWADGVAGSPGTSGADGNFEISVPAKLSGEFVLRINVAGTATTTECDVGYHGLGGITDYDRATRFSLGGDDISGIVVRLPVAPADLCQNSDAAQ